MLQPGGVTARYRSATEAVAHVLGSPPPSGRTAHTGTDTAWLRSGTPVDLEVEVWELAEAFDAETALLRMAVDPARAEAMARQQGEILAGFARAAGACERLRQAQGTLAALDADRTGPLLAAGENFNATLVADYLEQLSRTEELTQAAGEMLAGCREAVSVRRHERLDPEGVLLNRPAPARVLSVETPRPSVQRGHDVRVSPAAQASSRASTVRVVRD